MQDRWLQVGGRAPIPFGSALSESVVMPGGRFCPARAFVRLSPRRLAKTVPKIATPNEAPMDRKNVAPEVATPRSSYETAFCTISTRTCMTRPRPRPKTKKYALISAVLLFSSIWCSRSRPMAVMPVPATGNTFQRPVRLTICPETVDDSSSPKTIGSMCTPDSVGVTPCTTWRNVGR